MADTVWDRIEEARARHDVLQHPFYVRWSAGELTAEELARYSGQYRHAVTAIAELSAERGRGAARAPRARRATPTRSAPTSRSGTASSTRSTATPAPRRPPRRAECVEVWTERDGALRALARLYAIESGQPEISKTKLEGLAAHYDVDSEPGHPLLHGPPRPRRRARRRGPRAPRGADRDAGRRGRRRRGGRERLRGQLAPPRRRLEDSGIAEPSASGSLRACSSRSRL